MDFGIIHKGYCSDMTRTVFLGKPKPEERKAYEAVLEAQENAVDAVAPGARCAEVDEAARSVLRREGLAEFFTHSTGHGVGIGDSRATSSRRRTDDAARSRAW